MRVGVLDRKSRSALGGALLIAFSVAAEEDARSPAADGFTFDLAAPALRIALPDVPPVSMRAHPLQDLRPHLRFLGSEGAYTVSIMLRERADASPRVCAGIGIPSVVERSGLAESRIVRFESNERTTVLLYSVISHDIVQLSAHVLSGDGGACLEAHVSKIADSREEVAQWMQGFRDADVSTRAATR